MVIASFVVSVGSLVVALGSVAATVVGIVLVNRRARVAERISLEARDETRALRVDSLWSAHIESVHAMLTLDPASSPVKAELQRLRVTATELIDGLPDWDGLGRWLGAEHAVCSAHMREAMDHSKPNDTVDERVALLRPGQDWTMAYIINLRRFRSTGKDPEALRSLADHAQAAVSAIYARNGWDDPEMPNFSPLE